MIGLLDIRQGRGAWVRRADVSVLSDVVTFCLAQQPDALDDVMQARVAIECQAIRLACVRAGNADLDRIGRLLAELPETLPDPERGGHTDFAFHLAIVEASRSPVLVTLYKALAELLQRSHVERRRQTIAVPGIVETLVDAHREVFLSIIARDPEEADLRLRQHFAIGDELRRKSYIAAFTKSASQSQD
jgi:DNA-binding FadR family transcriptional regulator